MCIDRDVQPGQFLRRVLPSHRQFLQVRVSNAAMNGHIGMYIAVCRTAVNAQSGVQTPAAGILTGELLALCWTLVSSACTHTSRHCGAAGPVVAGACVPLHPVSVSGCHHHCGCHSCRRCENCVEDSQTQV